MSTIERALNDERSTLSVSARKSSGEEEKQFLAEVKQAFTLQHPDVAQAELVNWGGWWRRRFRENADKARRVLADIGGMIRERRITSNAGAAAMDLWKRLP
jgi:hypothetical protein